ncbi:MAG: hypothetical protein RLZZ522_1477, partial [Verrucomicrobiota bacterium]
MAELVPFARFPEEPKGKLKREPLIERDDARLQAALELCGDYVLKTDHTLGGPELWKLYMTLLRAEEGFGALKGALGLRPNFHQLEGRVEGHIF